jgi:polar amino acid transport system substrate-binding protein
MRELIDRWRRGRKRFMLGAILVTALSGCGGEKAEDELVIGMELTYPPFEMKDESGNPSGISYDMAVEMAKKLGRKLVVKDMRFEGLRPALESGKIDLIFSSMTITEERKKGIDFSDPYVGTELGILVAKDSPITGVEDLKREGVTVAVKLATTGQDYATAELKNAELKILPEAGDCVVQVMQGKADAFIYDQLSIFGFWEDNKDATRPILDRFRREYWGIGVRKGNDALRESVNAFLKEFRDGGGYQRLSDKYLADRKEEFEKMGTGFVTE